MARNEHKKVLQQLSEAYENVINEGYNDSDAALWRKQLEKEGPGLDFPKQKVKGQMNRPDDDDGERGAPLWPPTDPEKIARLKRAADRVRGRSREDEEDSITVGDIIDQVELDLPLTPDIADALQNVMDTVRSSLKYSPEDAEDKVNWDEKDEVDEVGGGMNAKEFNTLNKTTPL